MNDAPLLNGLQRVLDGNRYSTLPKLLRVTVLCVKFLRMKMWSKLQTVTTSRYKTSLLFTIMDKLSASPTTTALDLRLINCLWVRSIQREEFPELLEDLSNGRPNTLQRQMGLCLDPQLIICCQGRLLWSSKGQDDLPPALLPRHHWFTTLAYTGLPQQVAACWS